MLASADSLFDQSVLLERAERLVQAALRAGADTADAVAVRSLSLSIELRDGAVEESESAEGDDLGLRVLVGKRQAVVSSNDLTGDPAALAERRAFPDHHRFSAEDAADLVMRADEQGLALITTEKDRARMTGDPAAAALSQRAHVLPVTMQFAGEEELRRAVTERIARRR